MEEIARQTYALEADAQAIQTRAAHLARGSDPALWEAARALPRYGDIPRAFAAQIAAGGGIDAATRAAFAAWYASAWRRENYYLASCTAYLDRLDEQHRVQRYDPLPEDHFDRLCALPGGGNYGCHETGAIRLEGTGLR